MKNILIILTMLSTTTLVAQTTATWLGGTPGRETNWEEARNWSNYRVPDEFSNVIIKHTNSGHQSQPTIRGTVEVLSIEIQSNAALIIDVDGSLLINGDDTYTRGVLIYGGQLYNNGKIDLRQIDNSFGAPLAQQCKGEGVIVTDDDVLNCAGFASID